MSAILMLVSEPSHVVSRMSHENVPPKWSENDRKTILFDGKNDLIKQAGMRFEQASSNGASTIRACSHHGKRISQTRVGEEGKT
jgi:hypothetical protein